MSSSISLAPPFLGKASLADLMAIPKPSNPFWVGGYEFNSQIGFPNGGYGPTDPTRQWNWVVSGTAGSTTLTYVSGDLFSDIGTSPFSVVIHHTNGEWRVYSVLTSNGSTITLNRPLDFAVTSGAMSNLHFQGNHLTENGYYALADHIYTFPRSYASRDNYLERFLPTDTVGKWVVIGGGNPYNITYNNGANSSRSDNRIFAASARGLDMVTTATGQGIQWPALNLNQRKGILEINLGLRAGSTGLLTVTFDGQGAFGQVLTPDFKTIRIPFNNCKIATITITNSDNSATAFTVGRIIAWSNSAPAGGRLFNPYAKVVMLMDSWGVFPTSANGQSGVAEAVRRRLEQRMFQDTGVLVPIQNFSSGGKTSRWARWWFKTYVLDNKPDYVIIGLGTNDANGISSVESLPDGSTAAQGPVSAAEYAENINWMIAQCEANGIVPIIVRPSSSGVPGQAQARGAYDEILATGGALATVTNSYDSLYANTFYADALQGGGGLGAGNPMAITTTQPNSSVRIGLDVKSSAATTGGSLFQVSNNTTPVFGIDFDGLVAMPRFSIGYVSGQNQLRTPITELANRIALVVNPATGKGMLVYCDGTNWRYVSDGTVAV